MKSRNKIALWIVGGVWFAAMLALIPRFVSLHRETLKLEGTFAGYSAALVNHRFEDAYRFCGSSFQQATPYDQFVDAEKKLETQV